MSDRRNTRTLMRELILTALDSDSSPFLTAGELWNHYHARLIGSHSTFYRALWELEAEGAIGARPMPSNRRYPGPLRVIIAWSMGRVR